MTTIETTLKGYERLNNSTNGNPRYRLHEADGLRTWDTQSDAACNYDVENLLGSGPLPAGRRRRVTLHLTRAGRVWDIVEVER